jgi:oxygen-independent coproporphyrinogen-3 oxidase
MLRLDGTLRGRDVAVLRESGLRTVGLETEYGTGDGWARQLDRLAELEPDHVTLHLPPGPTVSRAELLRGVRLARTRLAAGFRNYALHHFARPGHEWRHLLADLSGAPLAGFGPGALTRTAAHVRRNPSGFDDYLAGGTATAVPRGTAPDLMNELLSLRGIGLDSAAPDRVSPLLESGLLEKRGGRLLLTDQGALALDRVRLLLTGPGAQPVP